MRITLAQINFEPEDLEGHFDRIMDIISEKANSDLIVFPELILQGHPSDLKPEGFLYRQLKVHLYGASQMIYGHVKKHDARVVIGELQKQGDLFRNLATYVDKKGPKHYAKTHVHWTENFHPGGRFKVFQTPLGPLGLNICFDSAFSETWRVLGLNGAKLVVNISAVPAHFPVPYMQRRMQGAATFNQYHVVYVNRPGPVFSGGSAVYDPRGEQVAALGGGMEIRDVDIDLSSADLWRKEEVIFKNRRPLLYRRVASRKKDIGLHRKKRRLKIAS